jgi:hypothetical protein
MKIDMIVDSCEGLLDHLNKLSKEINEIIRKDFHEILEKGEKSFY